MHSSLHASLVELPRALALTAGKGICLISEPCSLKQHFQSDLEWQVMEGGEPGVVTGKFRLGTPPKPFFDH